MPPASDDNDKDGFVDRLAKSIFASPDSPFTAFADRQRVERLEQCGELQRIVDVCQAAANSTKNDTSNNVDVDIPSSKSAKRISRFFKWNSVDQSSAAQQQIDTNASDVFTEAASSFTNDNESGNSNNQRSKTSSNSSRQNYSKGCVIETHELWACKALAVGCGNFLSDLRQCWTQQQIEDAQRSENEGITYHNSSRDNCRDIQIDMGRCVKKNIKELDDRAAKRQ